MKKKIILAVENNSQDERLTLRVLENSNMAEEVIVARDGVQKHLGREYGDSTVILLDLKMPGLNGLELLRTLRWDFLTASFL